MKVADKAQKVQRFILEAIDPDFGCSVLETMLCVDDLEVLRSLLGPDAEEDEELRWTYYLSSSHLDAMKQVYGVDFDPGERECYLNPMHSIDEAPYLVHTGYELFLMLEGVKPFAFLTNEHPAEEGDPSVDALFDPFVKKGEIVRRIMPIQASEKPVHGPTGRVFEGIQRVFYALPGEEWRIDAFNLLQAQLAFGPWNDTLERLEGSPLGYTDEQNEWWIQRRRKWETGRELGSSISSEAKGAKEPR